LILVSVIWPRAAGGQNGQTAIDIYNNALVAGNPIDAVILDLTVPGGMGGKETV
jgi:hypothetical protein